MNFEILTQNEAYPHYKKLYSEVKKNYLSFNGLDFFNLRLFKGDFLLLKNRFNIRVLALFNQNQIRILITHYEAKSLDAGIPHSLGAILVANDISNEELSEFNTNLKKYAHGIQQKIIFPLNAHFNLGFSIPSQFTDPERITFLTSAENQNIRRFISYSGAQYERKFYGMSYKLEKAPEYLSKIKSSIQNPPSGFHVEKLSLINYKKDIRDYNSIINESFKSHYAFFPLSFEEEWDLMKTAALVINFNYFRFLSHKNKRIAVSMFLPDYNTILKNGEDLNNLTKILFSKKKIKRVRGVNVAILPEYQGKGLIKYVRNPNLIQMIEDGIEIIESSYIDQENINSIENVKSTGALPSHTFDLYSFN
ncbi:MAG: hypothetical protein AB7I27_07590 [Bacteriovoracaceae bacterium]